MISDSNSQKPLVAVLMTVYNASEFLKEAIDSILNQTFTEFDFVIVNDGSTDSSESIIKHYKDDRIKLLSYQENKGFAYALNVGLASISAKYIVRMDADDISLPIRIEKLVAYMEANSSIGIYGSSLKRFGKDNEIWNPAINDAAIKARLLFATAMMHPTIIIRNEVLTSTQLKYRNNFPPSEDYDFFYRLSAFTNFANTNEVLYHYRIHTTNMTAMSFEKRIESKKRLYQFILSDFGIVPTEDELLLHFGFSKNTLLPNYTNLKKYKNWLNKIKNYNLIHKKINTSELELLLQNKWDRLFYVLLNNNAVNIFSYIIISRKLSARHFTYFLKLSIKKQLHLFKRNSVSKE
jgi:glycosyltransferase involved in cell wall biosynthesis